MRRRINWKLGDSAPEASYVTLNIEGEGTIQIDTGFPTSSVNVSFARTYLDKILDTYGSAMDLRINVEDVNETGFILSYKNVPADIPLEINYIAM